METIIVSVDDHNLNATHFAGFKKDEAVKRMKKDGITKDAEWAEKAWAECRKKVTEQTKMTEADLDSIAERREADEKLAEINRSRQASGVEPIASLDELGEAAHGPVNNSSQNVTAGKNADPKVQGK